jgi:phage tail sheath gpL-like
MTITSVLDTSNRIPGSYIEVQLGVGISSAGDAPRKVLLCGHETSAGSATADTPVAVYSEADAVDLFGQGSELHLMVRSALRAYRGVTLFAVPLAEPGAGTAASDATLIFSSGPSTADGSVTLYIRGERIDVAIPSGSSATVAGGLVADAINDLPDLPVTASNGAGTVTVTAKTKGTRGNNISIRSSGTATGLAIAHGSPRYLASGATVDTITTALAAIDPERYHLIAVAHDDAVTVGLWKTHVNDNAAPTEGRRQQVVCGTKDTLANAITLATGINAARVQVAWHYNADDEPSVVAAAVASTRAGLEGADPAAPMSQPHGTVLGGLRPQYATADRPISSELKSALDNGITPVSLDNAGNAYILRSVTSRSQDTTGAPNYAVLDTSKVTVPDYVADQLESWWSSFVQVAGKLAPDDADGEPPPPGVATPSTIKDGIYAELKALEPQMLVNVDLQLPNLVVEIAASPDGRVNALIPCDVVEGAYQFAAGVQQVG